VKSACVILAAGLGTRMNSPFSKVLHNVYGVPMLQYVLNTARQLKPEKIVVVAGGNIDLMKRTVDSENILYAVQKKQKGTAHALMCSSPALKNFIGVVIVLNGDTPLINYETIKKFLRAHVRCKNIISVLSFKTDSPGSYGRILRDESGRVLSIIEDQDADYDQKNICEVNSGVYAINHGALCLLEAIKMNRKKGEYYLTDIIDLAVGKGLKTEAFCIGTEEEFMGVNTKEELHRASRSMKRIIVRRWAEKGVSFLDEDSVFIHPNVTIGRGTTIYPNVHLEYNTKLGERVTIYPNVRICNSAVGNEAVIKDSTVIENSRVKNRASVGPFAHVRPGSEIGSGARIGNFVELKKAKIGKKTKASHLSYLGDAIIGNGVNIGAGTITCNFDGKKKQLTIIDDDVFVGSDSQLIAPVRIGKGAYIAAGSTITKDVPEWALALTRTEQKKIQGWAKKKFGVKRKESRRVKKKGAR
jgi:bifunctional UDP-N-acetylglucosamine pyrophosphorylase/glucosamine-1-phosphate N-acetyltransferase